MAPVLLKEFTLALPVDTFVEAFWLNSHWYERFLVDKLRDIDVSIEEWACSAADTNIKNRRVRCFHPSNISFPGLPSHAEVSFFIVKCYLSSYYDIPGQSLKSQSLEVSTHNENLIRAIIRESNSFCGIPYADYFTVHTEWVAASDPGKSECSVHIYLEVRFVKSTWLQGTIESNTKAEILQVVETWLEFANHYIRQQNWISTQKIVLPSSDTGERKVEESYDDEGVQDYDEGMLFSGCCLGIHSSLVIDLLFCLFQSDRFHPFTAKPTAMLLPSISQTRKMRSSMIARRGRGRY